MNKSDNNYFKLITNVFSEKFVKAYRRLKGRNKSKIIKYAPVMFKRWYHSALLDETILSPANIIEKQELFEEGSIYATSAKPLYVGRTLKGFDFELKQLSFEEHPVVNDLISFLEYSKKTLELDDELSPSQKEIDNLKELLSNSDPYYPEFLLEISLMLNLMRYMPAIYTNKAQLSSRVDDYFEKDKNSIFKDIFNCSLKLSSIKMNEVLPIPSEVLTEKGLLRILKEQHGTDEIFDKIYQSIGLDVKKIFDYYESNIDEEELEHDSNNFQIYLAFFLGIAYDRWFITPLSDYLKLLRPLYFLNYDIESEIEGVFEDLLFGSDVCGSLFAPCAVFSLTSLGERLLNHKDKKSSLQTLPRKISIEEINEIIYYVNQKKEHEEKESSVTKVYKAKVKYLDDKRYWKNIEVCALNSLHEFHVEICEAFDFEIDSDYSFFMGEEGNKLFQYSNPGFKGRIKKANEFMFSGFELEKKNKFIYVNQNTKMEIEITDIKMIKGGTLPYPKTVSQSKLMKQFEDDY